MRRIAAVDLVAAACALAFVGILALAAYWDPTIRVLHAFEALPYLAAAVLCVQKRKVGYVLGVTSGLFWLLMGGVLTSFVRNGFERVAMLVRSGHVDRWDVLIGAPAGCFTAGLAFFCLWGYARTGKRRLADIVMFVGALLAVSVYFLGLFVLFAPQYLRIFRRFAGA